MPLHSRKRRSKTPVTTADILWTWAIGLVTLACLLMLLEGLSK